MGVLIVLFWRFPGALRFISGVPLMAVLSTYLLTTAKRYTCNETSKIPLVVPHLLWIE